MNKPFGFYRAGTAPVSKLIKNENIFITGVIAIKPKLENRMKEMPKNPDKFKFRILIKKYRFTHPINFQRQILTETRYKNIFALR